MKVDKLQVRSKQVWHASKSESAVQNCWAESYKRFREGRIMQGSCKLQAAVQYSRQYMAGLMILIQLPKHLDCFWYNFQTRMAAITAIGIGCHCSADYNVTCRSLSLAWFGSADQSGWRRNISGPSEIASTKSKNEKGWERKKKEHEKNDIASRYFKMLQQNMSPCPSMSPREQMASCTR
jgi:hypothetical protein